MQTVALPALSLWQPYASLIFTGDKKHETRSWALPEKYRNALVAIHATVGFPPIEDRGLGKLVRERFGEHAMATPPRFDDEDDDIPASTYLPRGALIGTCRFVNCMPTQRVSWAGSTEKICVRDNLCGDFSIGRFAWLVHDAQLFTKPVPMRGSRQFWTAHVPQTAFPILAS